MAAASTFLLKTGERAQACAQTPAQDTAAYALVHTSPPKKSCPLHRHVFGAQSDRLKTVLFKNIVICAMHLVDPFYDLGM